MSNYQHRVMVNHSVLNSHGDHDQDVQFILSKTLILLTFFKVKAQSIQNIWFLKWKNGLYYILLVRLIRKIYVTHEKPWVCFLQTRWFVEQAWIFFYSSHQWIKNAKKLLLNQSREAWVNISFVVLFTVHNKLDK